jgi:hypothetical protein
VAKTPFTQGKPDNRGGAKPGGKFTTGTGGHVAKGVHRAAGNTTGSTANGNTRIGSLKKRMTGANGRSGMPK